MLRWGLGVAAVGLSLAAIVWAAALFKDPPPPQIIEKPLIIDREKPIIIEKPFVVEPRVIEKPAPQPAGPETRAEELKQRLLSEQRRGKTVTDFSIFHTSELPGFPDLVVKTGWQYENVEAKAPSLQWCYVRNHKTDLVYEVANNSTPAPFDAAKAARVGITAHEIAAALPFCQWFTGAAPANIRT